MYMYRDTSPPVSKEGNYIVADNCLYENWSHPNLQIDCSTRHGMTQTITFAELQTRISSAKLCGTKYLLKQGNHNSFKMKTLTRVMKNMYQAKAVIKQYELLLYKEAMSKYHYSAEKVFKVNVGGTLYTTTRSTLTKYEGSLIWRIFTGDMACPRDERGTYFLDRDGHVFRFILNYLRSDKLVVPQGYRDLDILKVEADYYGLEGLVREVDSLIALRKRRRRPRQRNKSSQSTGELHRLVERNGDLYLSDEGSDYFYD